MATQKAEGLSGVKLLVVQPLDRKGAATGRPQVACDTVKAGPGDYVYLVGAREASHALEDAFTPVDAAIVGIIDEVDQVLSSEAAKGSSSPERSEAPAESTRGRSPLVTKR